MWLIFLTPISIITFLFYYASTGGFGDMPDLEVLENPKTNLASEIFTSEGKTLAKYYFNDNRTPVTFDELPTHLVDALIATRVELPQLEYKITLEQKVLFPQEEIVLIALGRHKKKLGGLHRLERV